MNEPIPRWMDEELAALRDAVAKFAEAQMLPHDAAWRAQHNVGREIWRRAGEQGLLCTDIPAQYGGAGGDFRHEAVIYEELNRRGLSGFGQGVHSIAAHYLLNHGTEAQKQQFLPRLARGELIGAIGITEPGAGSDMKGIRTRAVRDGEHYVVNGSKIFISNGLLAGLIALVVKTDAAPGSKSVSLLLVETQDLPGFRVGRVLDKMGLHAQDTAELFFDGARVPAANLLGGEAGKGMYQLMSDLPYERIIIGVCGVAAMEGALAATLAYTRERKAFGQSIYEFQNTRFRLAELATIVRVARSFIDDCIVRVAAGKLDTVTASMAKWWISDMQQKVLDECVQLHGGYGYMNEYLVCRLFADSRVQRIYGGTNEIMKEVIARAL
ncbi:MAG: acyl-CoA dehydrogenase family protein [Gammaproteobacteria bacterium]|nr:acyl-CoA dehydrogenase family protein [Gammaproteobacteria bacterium]MDE2250161.1 acyl-CoA dehydrogenase family protein [Gammaproteobacteria bacterium]